MRIINARVDYVRAGALAGTLVVTVNIGARLAVGDAAETPRGTILLSDAIDS